VIACILFVATLIGGGFRHGRTSARPHR